jgi:zinc transport system ATP-binding protein
VVDALKFSNLSFSYGDHVVLEDINLNIKDGDFIAILGHNGAGKSTLMKLALGLLQNQQGTIELFGKNIGKFDDHSLIGYVQQSKDDFDPQFPATVEEVVLMGRMGTKKGFFKNFDKNDKIKAHHAMDLVGIKNLKERRIGQLSGGQRQKVFLAKALCSDVKVLFLDEPTTAMDYNSQHAFYDTLQLLNEKGITIVLITHDLGQILQHVKRVAVLNRKIVFEGEPEKFDKSKIWDLTERV